MYEKVMVTLENSQTDRAILDHIVPLAQQFRSRLLLVHVADGWVARHGAELKLAESEEMRVDRTYLTQVCEEMQGHGLEAEMLLLMGEPADEIIKVACEQGVDLIAMSTHGHRFLSDLIYGTTVDKVRHAVEIPLLLLKAPRA